MIDYMTDLRCITPDLTGTYDRLYDSLRHITPDMTFGTSMITAYDTNEDSDMVGQDLGHPIHYT